MGFLGKLFGKSADARRIKTVYSFIATTNTLLDLNTVVGKTVAHKLVDYTCQKLRQDAKFDRLYSQVDKEQTPNIYGTAMVHSPSNNIDAFTAWLKPRGINIHDKTKDKYIGVFSGDAHNPENGKSFTWTVLIYFQYDE